MKTSLYEEIVAAMREGNTIGEVTSLVHEAAAQVKKEQNANKISLDEARENYIKAVYDFYNAIGVETTMEGAEAQAKLIEKMSDLSNLFKSATSKSEETMNDLSNIFKSVSKSEPKVNSIDEDTNVILDFLKNM